MSSAELDADRAYPVIAAGGLVLLPTDAGYGLVGMSSDAVASIYRLKGRPKAKACVTVATLDIVDDVAVLPSPAVRVWLADVSSRLPIAVVNHVRPDSVLLAATPPDVLEQATSGGTIATFLNAGEILGHLAQRARADGRILIGSSANLSSTGNNYRFEDVPDTMRQGADLVLDRGPVRYANPHGLATTLLDLTRERFLRQGIRHAEIAASWAQLRASSGMSAA